MSKIYDCIAIEGERCANGFVSWRMLLAYFFCLGINGRPRIDFDFPLLAAISKRRRGTNNDDKDAASIINQIKMKLGF